MGPFEGRDADVIVNLSLSSLVWFLKKRCCLNAECCSETPAVKGLVPRMVVLLGSTAFKRWSLAGRC